MLKSSVNFIIFAPRQQPADVDLEASQTFKTQWFVCGITGAAALWLQAP
ncbi:MAG: hypothetical protein ACI9G1_001361 [Pirellulaceae bacterium]